MLAVLARSAPLIPYGDNLDHKVSAELYAEEYAQYSSFLAAYLKVKNAFDKEGIDPVQFYCSEYWNPEVLKQVMSISTLNDEVIRFQKFLEQFFLFPDELLCYGYF